MGRIAYAWHWRTHEYIGPRTARNKNSVGEYMLPGRCTWVKPPHIKEGELCVWTGNEWSVRKDYRGHCLWSIYDGSPYEVSSRFTDGTIPSGYIDVDPDIDSWKYPPMWNGKEWVVNEELAVLRLREERNQLLNDVDTIYCNADKWERMSDQKKKEWQVYKQQLRNLPETINFKEKQPAFPEMPKEELVDATKRNVQ